MSQVQAKGTFQPDSDVHITFEDQQKINKFARLNAKLDDLKEEIKVKENDSENLDDAIDEVCLLDEDVKIPYLVGEIFVYQNVETTQDSLNKAKEKIKNEIKELERKVDEVKETMSDLKSHLYGKFGNNINLEADEE